MLKVCGSILCLLLALMLTISAQAQQQPSRDQDEPIRLKADLVNITATVTDRQGRSIKSLKAEDFVIYEDGVKQKIDHFATTEAPFTLMLLLDISGSTRDDIALIKRAAKDFLRGLRSSDRVGVIVFSGDVELISEFTDSRARVETAIDQINSTEGANGYRFNTKTGTSFYDALYLAVEESPLKQVEGRKALVCMSDGVDSTSKLDYAEVAKLVEKSEASVYFLEMSTEDVTLAGLLKNINDTGYLNFSQSQIDRYYDEYDRDSIDRHRPRHSISPLMRREINAGLYKIARRQLREIADHTGGRVYPVNALTDLSAIYRQVADDLRSQYSLSYYPINDAQDGRWRSIRVEVRQAASVRARPGYWAK